MLLSIAKRRRLHTARLNNHPLSGGKFARSGSPPARLERIPMLVQMWTDGSSNPHTTRRAGYCAILKYNNSEKVVSGTITQGTNNIAELTALLEGLKALKCKCDVVVYSDSKDVIGWTFGWNVKTNAPDALKRWKRKVPHIRELCEQIDKEVATKCTSIRFEWIEGHTGDAMNERCDTIAKEMATRS
jgi:ribonuclease HI